MKRRSFLKGLMALPLLKVVPLDLSKDPEPPTTEPAKSAFDRMEPYFRDPNPNARRVGPSFYSLWL